MSGCSKLLMTDVLEDKRDLREADFCPKEVVMIVLELRVSIVVPSVIVN